MRTLFSFESKRLPAPLTFDVLRNQNCYEYLSLILEAVPPIDTETFLPASVLALFELPAEREYVAKFAYGNLYTRFLEALNADVVDGQITWPKGVKEALLQAVYHNENNALERAMILKAAVDRGEIVLEATNSPINTMTPSDANAVIDRVRKMLPGMIASHWGGRFFSAGLSYVGLTKPFKPMFETSIVSVRRYDYQANNEDAWTELRMGTQVERLEDGVARIYPIFDAWLTSLPEDHVHLYINKLSRDIPPSILGLPVPVDSLEQAERRFEAEMTEQLHKAEKRHANLIVITLPADKGLFDADAYLSRELKISTEAAFAEMQAILMGDSCKEIQDFYISKAAEEKIYQGKKASIVRELLANSFACFNLQVSEHQMISKAAYQAVYFHLMNYELTYFILQQLQPKTFNISCKDGIDRAAISSLYFHERRGKLRGDEFDRGLDAAAFNVKGRGVNRHRCVLWNVMDHLVEAGACVSDWLVTWRDNNVPELLQKSPDRQMRVCP